MVQNCDLMKSNSAALHSAIIPIVPYISGGKHSSALLKEL